MKGKYFLDYFNWEITSTNSFELYLMYHNLFYHDEYNRLMYWDNSTIEPDLSKVKPADHQDFIKALSEIKRLYECGYTPERIKTKNGWSRTIWIKNSEKASILISSSNILTKMMGKNDRSLGGNNEY